MAVSLPPGDRFRLVGVSVTPGPFLTLGVMVAERVTVPVKPFRLVSVTVELADWPLMMVKEDEVWWRGSRCEVSLEDVLWVNAPWSIRICDGDAYVVVARSAAANREQNVGSLSGAHDVVGDAKEASSSRCGSDAALGHSRHSNKTAG